MIDKTNENTKRQLRDFMQRAHNLYDEQDTIKDDISELFKEAKAFGFESKILRKIVAKERKDKVKVEEERVLMELYEEALKSENP